MPVQNAVKRLCTDNASGKHIAFGCAGMACCPLFPCGMSLSQSTL